MAGYLVVVAVMLDKRFDAIFSKRMRTAPEQPEFKLIIQWPELHFPGNSGNLQSEEVLKSSKGN